MQQSEDPCSVARSRDPKPVEGDSEIDIVLSTSRHLVFIEAKLGYRVESMNLLPT